MEGVIVKKRVTSDSRDGWQHKKVVEAETFAFNFAISTL